MSLSFSTLREANVARLPLFKNSRGEPAHSEPDGSDWLLSGWSNAAEGELGEVAEALEDFVFFARLKAYMGRAGNLIKKIERGDVTLEQKRETLAKELADVQTYLDILAYRAGIDLGDATIEKWNEISERAGVPLRLEQIGWVDDNDEWVDTVILVNKADG